MILTPSPLENLAAFALAFATGILFGCAMQRYARFLREDAIAALTPA